MKFSMRNAGHPGSFCFVIGNIWVSTGITIECILRISLNITAEICAKPRLHFVPVH